MNERNDKLHLIRYRMDQARAALREASLLRDNSDTTLGAVNRCYYAMFYAVLALLQKIGKVPRKHSGAISLFDSEFVRKGIFPKELSAHLHQAFAVRQNSDYQAIEEISLVDTDALIRNAEGFIEAVEVYLKGNVAES